ncbi:Recombinase NinB [uncultured Caudovirales phage]|uniref:Recombinase NinB n=1 Tax=uncultured Caudovirales phage TaxID=2100421 RepID=A0A6J5S101_9CAUD|nr:Recombinase NinB [uncultured Caudovirales phage]
MSDAISLRITGPLSRGVAVGRVQDCPDGMIVRISKPTRREDQSARFHAICSALAASSVEHYGKRRTKDEWKFLLVSGNAIALKEDGELMLGLEMERLMMRPSTTEMSVQEMSHLIEYAVYICAKNGLDLGDDK